MPRVLVPRIVRIIARRWLFAIGAALLVASATPRLTSGEESLEPHPLATRLNQVCLDLIQARAGLREGRFEELDFADRVLDLFARVESLQVTFALSPEANRRSGSGYAMARALRYLVESLRENYVGTVARDGFRFVGADRALEAAVAWRSNIEALPNPGSR